MFHFTKNVKNLWRRVFFERRRNREIARGALQISTMFGASGDNYLALEHDGKRLHAKFAESNQDEESIK